MYEDLSFNNKHILIVDDSETNVLVLKGMLEHENYTSVYSVLSAKEAYIILEKENIDIILLDVVMPDIAGIEACQTINGMKACKNIPIIMVTADTSNKTLKKSFESGANDFITKPINQTNLKVRNINYLKNMGCIFIYLNKTN